jgi:hypothetical protein
MVTGSIIENPAKAGLQGALTNLVEREAFGEVLKSPHVQFRDREGCRKSCCNLQAMRTTRPLAVLED